MLCAQAQRASLQAALQDREASLQAMQIRLQEAESKLEALEQSAKAAMQAAQQRHEAVEERARLSEQVPMSSVTAKLCMIMLKEAPACFCSLSPHGIHNNRLQVSLKSGLQTAIPSRRTEFARLWY